MRARHAARPRIDPMNAGTPPNATDTPDAGRREALPTTALIAALFVGFALRVWEAVESSLWLDELHTLAHAAQPDLSSVAANVAREFHSPLFFVSVHLFGAWEEGPWLRVLPIVASLALFVPLVRLGRGAGVESGALALAGLGLACLPYQVHYGAMLRPYAWIALFGAGAVHAAFSERGTRKARFLLFFTCVVLGLWTHRVMAIGVVAIGAARLVVRSPRMLGLGWLILSGALAVATEIPWLLGFARQVTEMRFDHQEEVGGYELRPQLVKEVLALPLRLVVPYMGALGGPWAWLARAGTAAIAGALGLAALGRIRSKRWGLPDSPVLRGLAVFAVANFFAVTVASVYSWDRVPLQYYAPIAWLLPLFAAVFVHGAPAGRALSALAAAGVVLLGLAQAGGGATEDMRGAVERVRAIHAELVASGADPIVTAVLSQPVEVFSCTIPYMAYGPELGAIEPLDVPTPDEPGHGRPVICLRRGAMGLGRPLWADIVAGRHPTREERIDAYLTVFVFESGDGPRD